MDKIVILPLVPSGPTGLGGRGEKRIEMSIKGRIAAIEGSVKLSDSDEVNVYEWDDQEEKPIKVSYLLSAMIDAGFDNSEHTPEQLLLAYYTSPYQSESIFTQQQAIDIITDACCMAESTL